MRTVRFSFCGIMVGATIAALVISSSSHAVPPNPTQVRNEQRRKAWMKKAGPNSSGTHVGEDQQDVPLDLGFPKEPGWIIEAQFSGSGMKRTPLIVILTQEWRIRFRLLGGYVGMVLKTPPDNYVALVANQMRGASSSSYFYESGKYFLEITAPDAYVVQVESKIRRAKSGP